MQKASEEGTVFVEITEKGSKLSKGQSSLIIKASIKIPFKEFYLINRKPPRNENDQYPFVININGQGVLWMADCRLESQNHFIHTKENPEGGEGLKCRLEKFIRLKPGTYKVYLGLPEEKFSKDVAISLTDGSSNILEFNPIYWQRVKPSRTRDGISTFRDGVSDFDIVFNGKKY